MYDGDGNLARGIVNGVVTFYPGRQTNRAVDGVNVTMPTAPGTIGPEVPPLPHGASTFGDPNMAPLSGPYHRLPAGTELPSGMSVVADGVDIIPSSTNPPTHYSMYPTVSMPFDDFSKAFTDLPWSYVGKK